MLKFHERVVVAFACLIGLLVLAAACLTDRNGNVDELAMYNPAYMLAHFGRLCFGSYSYMKYFDAPVVIHPPVHVALIGWLSRMHLTWYYAELVPTLCFLFLGIVAIVRGIFPAPVKLG